MRDEEKMIRITLIMNKIILIVGQFFSVEQMRLEIKREKSLSQNIANLKIMKRYDS